MQNVRLIRALSTLLCLALHVHATPPPIRLGKNSIEGNCGSGCFLASSKVHLDSSRRSDGSVDAGELHVTDEGNVLVLGQSLYYLHGCPSATNSSIINLETTADLDEVSLNCHRRGVMTVGCGRACSTRCPLSLGGWSIRASGPMAASLRSISRL